MKKYNLKTKGGEVINKIDAESNIDAAELFAKIKNLSVKSLLEIYNVEQCD